MNIHKAIRAVILTLLYLSTVVSISRAQSPTAVPQTTDNSPEIQKQIEELSKKLTETQNKKTSLANQIAYMNNQIQLTSLKIQETGVKITDLTVDIEELGKRIALLESSLTNVSQLLIDRIKATYKSNQVSPVAGLFAAEGFSDLISRSKYLQLVQSHDKRLLFEVQATKSDFMAQKELLEVKKEELFALQKSLEVQSVQLDQQKKDKEYLLQVTANDEKKYQELIASAKAELEAIQAIIAGRGTESKVGDVKTGDRIASVIQGPSCNSSGAHVHFMVTEDGMVKNPFNYLKSGIEFENCSGSSCGSSDGDAFSPSGDWNWPIDPVVKYSQGHGSTWAVAHIPWLPYDFHDGIDINSTSSPNIKAVKDGVLYQGSYTGINGCRLRYVRVEHTDSNIDTLFLHINY